MKNREIAALLFNICALLERQQGNPYRIRAYRRAAQNLLRMPESVSTRAAAGEPLGIPKLGKSLTAKIGALAKGDPFPFYSELCADLPDTMRLLLLNVPGMGPVIAERIQRDLGDTDAAGIRRAVATGKIQKVWGVGPKRTAAIANALGGGGEMQQERLAI